MPLGVVVLGLLALPPLELRATELSGYEDITEFSLEELLQVGVASLEAESIFRSPSMVSVIDRQMIELYGFRSVSEALALLPGASVMRTHLKRQIPTLRGVLQDHYANKVLLLIDGVPAWHAVTGEGNLDRMNIDEVERIEVLLGPASVIYGTNAYAGAINIVSRKARDEDGEHQGAVATQLEYGGGIGASGAYWTRDEKLALSLSASVVDQGELASRFTDEDGVVGQAPEYLDTSSFNLRASWDGDWGMHQVLFNAYRQEESYLGVTPQFSAGVARGHELSGYLTGYNYSVEPSEALELRARGSFDWQSRDIGRRADDAVRARVVGWRGTAGLVGILGLYDWLRFELGADYEHRRSEEYANYDTREDRVLEDNRMADRSVNEFSVFGQARFELAPLLESVPLTLLAGMRWTHNELFDSNLSARASLVWELFANSAIKFAFGQSFRAPTPFELYFETSTKTVFGNTALNPETATTAELAYLLGHGKFFTQVLGYWSSYEDKIFRVRRAPDDAEDRSLIYRNGEAFSAWGVEAQVRFADPSIVDVFVNYGLLLGDSGDEVNGNGHYNFRYVPEHEFSFGVGKVFDALSVSTVLNMLGPRETTSYTIPTRFTWDLTLGYKTEQLQHQLWVKDVLDTRVEQPEYVRRKLDVVPGGMGRSIGYSLRAQF